MVPYDEEAVPSAPVGAAIEAQGGLVFERVRRATVGGRRCAPCDNSWVAVDRILLRERGRLGLLFRRHHDCAAGRALHDDLVARDLSAVGFEVIEELHGADGQVDVIVGDCPGVRLRALVEARALRRSGPWPREVAWHVVTRTGELRRAWRRLGVTPLDTFVGFDGSLHLFPTMPACFESEMPSFDGQEVFDPLLVDDTIERLDQLLSGTLPSPVIDVRQALARARGQALPVRPANPEVLELLAGSRSTDGAVAALAALVRGHFPAAYTRHRRVYEVLGLDLEADGRAREARILAGDPAPARAARPEMITRPRGWVSPDDPPGRTSRIERAWSWLRRRR